LAEQLNRMRSQLGYMPVSEVHHLLDRIGQRLSKIDEPLAREYMLDPFPDGIEQKIRQMCRRRQALFARLAQEELRAESERLNDEAASEET